MKINRIRTILAVLVMAAVLGGCVGKDHYNTSQMKAVIERGKPMLEAFISTLHEDDVTIGEYSMADGIIEGGLLYSGSYLSRAVYVEFSANGKNYKALVNTENGKIWTDYYMFDLNEQIKRQMEPYCERYGFSGDFKIEGASTYSVLHFKDVETNDFAGENTDTYVLIEDLISSVYNDEDVLKRSDEFLKDAPLDSFSVVYEATDGAVFDPRILADYLVETGNYKAEDTRSRVKGEYRINGEVVSDIEELMKR